MVFIFMSQCLVIGGFRIAAFAAGLNDHARYFAAGGYRLGHFHVVGAGFLMPYPVEGYPGDVIGYPVFHELIHQLRRVVGNVITRYDGADLRRCRVVITPDHIIAVFFRVNRVHGHFR